MTKNGIQPFQPDELFSVEKITRLTELMQCWRKARDAGQALSAAEQSELTHLVEAELTAANARTLLVQARLCK
jgi:hypothetical protein